MVYGKSTIFQNAFSKLLLENLKTWPESTSPDCPLVSTEYIFYPFCKKQKINWKSRLQEFIKVFSFQAIQLRGLVPNSQWCAQLLLSPILSTCSTWGKAKVHSEKRVSTQVNDKKNWRKKIKGSYEKKEVIGDIFYLRKRVQLALKWHLFYSVKAYILCFFFLKRITTPGKIFHDWWSRHISPLLTMWLRIPGENLNKKMFKKWGQVARWVSGQVEKAELQTQGLFLLQQIYSATQYSPLLFITVRWSRNRSGLR